MQPQRPEMANTAETTEAGKPRTRAPSWDASVRTAPTQSGSASSPPPWRPLSPPCLPFAPPLDGGQEVAALTGSQAAEAQCLCQRSKSQVVSPRLVAGCLGSGVWSSRPLWFTCTKHLSPTPPGLVQGVAPEPQASRSHLLQPLSTQP